MTAGAALVASLLATLSRPDWWLLALTSFLARGGFVLFLVPIVDLPSPLAVANALTPIIVPVALGRVSAEAVVLLAAVVGGLLSWVLVGGLLAAAADATLAREAAAEAIEEGIGRRSGIVPRPLSRKGLAARVFAARLAAAVPLAIAVGVGTVGIGAATYVELTRPGDVAAPLVLRVAVGAAGHVAAIVIAWAFAEAVGGAASRWIAIDGAGPAPAVWRATRDLVTKPGSIVVPWTVVTIVMAVMVWTLLAASGSAWQGLRVAVLTPRTELHVVGLALFSFVGIWLAGLLAAALLGAGRSAVGAFEHIRIAGVAAAEASVAEPPSRSEPGTFGASGHHRPGDRSGDDPGGSL